MMMLTCGSGLLEGVNYALHYNEKYPDWKNVLIPHGRENDSIVYVYTKQGWKEKKYVDICRQVTAEYLKCSLLLSEQLMVLCKEN